MARIQTSGSRFLCTAAAAAALFGWAWITRAAPAGDVIFSCDFESPEWYREWGLEKPEAGTSTVSEDPELKFEPWRGRALKVRIPEGGNLGSNLRFAFAKRTASEPEEIYFRYYLRLGDDWDPEQGGKLPGISGTYNRAGWGGRRVNGRDGWSARGSFERPVNGETVVGFYCYHVDMRGRYGSVWNWDRDRLGYLRNNRWYAIEQHVKLNTPGRNDGVMRAWVDGKLAFEKTDVRMRDVEDLKIEMVWMNVYQGGTRPARTVDHLYIDDVVISRSYIGPAPAQRTYVVVPPGTHPGIVFSEAELPALRRRAQGEGMAAEAWRRIRATAHGPYEAKLTVKQAVGREGNRLARQLETMALIYQVERDDSLGRKAVELFRAVATGIDAAEFHKEVDSDFFATEHWPKAFAFAWDWLYPIMTAAERAEVLARLEQWNAELYRHTESWWWRDATYNCGAIPVGAQGILLTAIQAESRHPEVRKWFDTCLRKARRNYFPLTWRENGICNEGPGYAHYHKNPTQFAEAVRRTGGEDFIAETGAVNAMHYLRHQWMPQGGCGPVGDNTEYGRRVFQPIYLHGIRELGDQAGLWTYLKYADLDRIDPLFVFLYYPDDLKPVSPGTLDLDTSHYFEIDRYRAGYLFARNAWDNERASWFVFVTRYENANHTHYDMNSFLFTAFGEPFATHANIFPYSHPHHGVDFEHNLVVIGEGGMPAADRPNSAGDDGSIKGFMTGVVAGRFADYARGDARLSYADRSIRTSTPAQRADRTVLFAKRGPNPYVVIADDIQKDETEHDYHWQWYTEAKAITGEGSIERPFEINGARARCRIAFLEPAAPGHDFRVVEGADKRRALELGLLRVNRRGVRVRYLAVAAAWETGSPAPTVRRGPEFKNGASIVVEGQGFRDFIVWQPEESPDAGGQPFKAGPLETDALLAMVRTNAAGKVTGYVIGDGRRLAWNGQTLVQGEGVLSASVDGKRAAVEGARRARSGLAPLEAAGALWLPETGAMVRAGR